ncbi:MAG TPA: hypothetical protein VHM91_08180 [Verrucomicrobiales bacterium]|nr:hypothetical protein [Verrucomicrobiales bacterium]
MSRSTRPLQPLLRGFLCLSLCLLPACSSVPVTGHKAKLWNQDGFWTKVSDDPPSWIPSGLPLKMPSKRSGRWIVDARDGWRFFVPSKGSGKFSTEYIRIQAYNAASISTPIPGGAVYRSAGGSTGTTVSTDYSSSSSDWSSSDSGSYGSGHGHDHGHHHDDDHGSGSGGGGGHDHGGGSGGGHDHGDDSGSGSGSGSSGGGHDHSGSGSSGGGSSSSDSSSSKEGMANRESSSSNDSSSKEGMADKHR